MSLLLRALKAGTKLAPDKEAREAITKALRGHGAVGQVNLSARTEPTSEPPTG
jgi:hypothetical protein